MPKLQHLREGIGSAWERVIDGWQHLYRRASDALTQFTGGGHETGADRQELQEFVQRSSGWGLLAAEVFDDDERVVVRVEAPGLDKDDFDLEVRDDYLIVRGQKRVARERTRGRWHVTECAYGNFERVIPLPDTVDTGKAGAEYRHGVLRVELPKSAGRRRTKVTIR